MQEHLDHHGIKLALGDGVAGFASSETHGLIVETQKGKRHQADLVILAMGVRPETALARAAGLEIGERGGIRVDAQMRTSDPNIWAVGDAVEVKDAITGSWTLVPLAGPASRQGRIAADAIFGLSSQFRGVQGTAICSVFELSVASTGASEKSLIQARISDYEKVYLHPYHHAQLLSRCRTDQLETPVPKIGRKNSRRTSCRQGGRGQTHRRHSHGDPETSDCLRS